jgi:hypothetical protein
MRIKMLILIEKLGKSKIRCRKKNIKWLSRVFSIDIRLRYNGQRNLCARKIKEKKCQTYMR